MKNLILDFANLSSILRFGMMNKDSNTLIMNDTDWKNYFLDNILVSISNYINVLGGDRVILALENRSWRKSFYPLYKANRDKGKEEDEKLELFYEAMNEAIDFFDNFTNIKTIRADGAEGDDIIAVLTQKFAAEGDKTTIVSTDGDFKQLLRYKGVRIFNPIKKIYISDGYSHLDYITKLIKGDNGDNVPSSYPRIKKDILESIANNSERLEIEFDNVDRMIKRQKFFIAKLLGIEEIPDDLTDEEWEEVLSIAKEKRDKIRLDVKKAKEWNEFKDDEALKQKDKSLREIIKLAKNEGITEGKLFNKIESFRDGFRRNEKLICLKLDNLPEYVVENILVEFEKDHSAKKQSEYLKFVRKHKLREFAFGPEWNILKSVKDI